jgi:hypothetical protein
MLCLSKPGPKFPKPYVNFGYGYKLKFKLLLSNLEFVENVTMQVIKRLESGYGVWCHFQQYFSYIMAVSFIGGGK